MFSRTLERGLWFFGKHKFPLSVPSQTNTPNRLNKMHSTQGPTDSKCSTKNIFVQVLPVITATGATHTITEHSGASLEATDVGSTLGKILLCKWASGAFKDRYTGLIKPLSTSEQINIRNLSVSQKHQTLLQIAKAIIPAQLRSFVADDLELVGLLTFEDPPACDEYIYRVNLTASSIDTNQEMPDDDALWYPKVLWEGQKVKGTFTFGSWSEKTIKSYELHLVNQIE